MFKKISALFFVLFTLSACTKQDSANANAPMKMMEFTPNAPTIEGERPEVTDPAALSLMALFNSQTPVARLPEENDSTLVFTAPNGDEFHLRRTALNVVVNAEPFLVAGVDPEKFSIDNGIMYNSMLPTIFFTKTPARTLELTFFPVETVVNNFVHDAPELISSNGFDFTLGNDLVRLTWNAQTLQWSLGVNAKTLTDTGLDVSLLQGYVLKDGFLMNTMQPIS
jgi:hypothetical protein